VKARFLGLDLAWVDTNPSGLAALDEEGRLQSLRADLRSNADILTWIRQNLGDCGTIAIDMPTIVTNETKQRDCERALRVDFHSHDARPYPANRRLAPFFDGGRARYLIGQLGERVTHTTQVVARDPRTVAFETFPHAAAVRLFALDKIKKYKKKRREWDLVLTQWAEYRALLDTLRDKSPPLLLDDEKLPPSVTKVRYKRWDDAIDAVVCAYVAAFVWTHGSQSSMVRVYGDMATGHIVIPAGPAPVKAPPDGYRAAVEPVISGPSLRTRENHTWPQPKTVNRS
jgi:predicted RNase H-like nuclease